MEKIETLPQMPRHLLLAAGFKF